MEQDSKCQWIGDNEYCDHAALPGRSYCEQHLWRVYQKGTALRRRKKDLQRANQIWDFENAFNEAVQELQEEGFDI